MLALRMLKLNLTGPASQETMKPGAVKNGNNVSVPVTEGNTEEMSNDPATTSTDADKAPNVPASGQDSPFYSAASAQMIALANTVSQT